MEWNVPVNRICPGYREIFDEWRISRQRPCPKVTATNLFDLAEFHTRYLYKEFFVKYAHYKGCDRYPSSHLTYRLLGDYLLWLLKANFPRKGAKMWESAHIDNSTGIHHYHDYNPSYEIREGVIYNLLAEMEIPL